MTYQQFFQRMANNFEYFIKVAIKYGHSREDALWCLREAKKDFMYRYDRKSPMWLCMADILKEKTECMVRAKLIVNKVTHELGIMNSKNGLEMSRSKILTPGVELWHDKNGEDTLLLIRCPKCRRENWTLQVATGTCSWCGYDAHELLNKETKDDDSRL